jgi:hypothetical protein
MLYHESWITRKLCSILGTHSSGYKEFCFLGYNAVQSVASQVTFQGNMLPVFQGQRVSQASNIFRIYE